MANEKYNGWSNRETWIVNLWITNDVVMLDDAKAAVAAAGDDAADQADVLRSYMNGVLEPVIDGSGFAGDLINAALDRANFAEIAADLMED